MPTALRFTAEAALSPAGDGRVPRLGASLAPPIVARLGFGATPALGPRALTVGKSCDDIARGQCVADRSSDCDDLVGVARGRCLLEIQAECRDAFGCPTGYGCSPGGPGSICCPSGQTNCSGVCKALRTDPANCGSCGHVCAPGSACCSGVCRTVAADPANCGACGVVCPPGMACNGGVCGCPPGQTLCGNVCVDLASDSENCGVCGNRCPPSAQCRSGVCAPKACDDIARGQCVADRSSDCDDLVGVARGRCLLEIQAECRDAFGCPTGYGCSPGGPGSICCPSGQTNCSGVCKALRTDPANCGSCGHVCAPGDVCCNGVCSNLATDPSNCGSCGTVCTGGKICQNGVCVCPPGMTDCGGTCRNLLIDHANCGSCGRACDARENCQNGVCVCRAEFPTRCPTGCANLSNDVANCGSCGTVCTGGKICQNGVCVCRPGMTDCGGTCRNLQNDTSSCGACGKACAFGQGCCAGTCKNLANDTDNCGSCGHVCTATSCSGDRKCVNGSCLTPQPVLVTAENPTSLCYVGSATPLAFSPTEATTCVQQQFPGLKIGTGGGAFFHQIYRLGQTCIQAQTPALSESDALACVKFNNVGAVVVAGACQDCFPYDNCRGKCVDRSSDNANCGFCDAVCSPGTTCINGFCTT